MHVFLIFRLDALGTNAYEAFMASRDLHDVVNRVKKAQNVTETSKGGLTKTISIRAQLMTPIQPMLVSNRS
jgi:hypothetical protein